MPIEEMMVHYAAPTLAGYKVANLMSLPGYICERRALSYCQKCLECTGLEICVLREKAVRRLILVYRKSALKKLLAKKEVQHFLSAYGYTNFDLFASLDQLKRNLTAQDVFPHEIGVFLGYPLSDVQAFIDHRGKDAKLSGCWKVYSNEAEALKTFSLYDHCRKELSAKYRQGVGLAELSAVG